MHDIDGVIRRQLQRFTIDSTATSLRELYDTAAGGIFQIWFEMPGRRAVLRRV